MQLKDEGRDCWLDSGDPVHGRRREREGLGTGGLFVCGSG